MSRPAIDVWVVEDSPVTQQYLVTALSQDPELRVTAAFGTGEAALERLAAQRPDVILMDIILPGMDGLEATRRIMATDPVPIVVCTAGLAADEVHTVVRALDAGALAALRKPPGPAAPGADAELATLRRTLKLMAEVKLVRRWSGGPSLGAVPRASAREGAELVVIGASTGGPRALSTLLAGLPAAFPVPILLVQHMTEGFIGGLVEWLGASSGRPVSLAREGERPSPGHVYVAPDGGHLRVGPRGELQVGGPRSESAGGHQPSVAALFRSVRERYDERVVGVLLTGMGTDGAAELAELARAGAPTVVQDQASSVVFGMPGEAVRLGAARWVLPPDGIAELLPRLVARQGVRSV